jgi:hypothetical protein
MSLSTFPSRRVQATGVPCRDRRLELLDEPVMFRPDGVVPYEEGYRLAVPQRPGIYLFADLRGPLYVGKSTDLRRRFLGHEQSHNADLRRALHNPAGEVRFLWCEANLGELAEIERRTIAELCPICNIRLNDRPETRRRRNPRPQ